MGDRMKQIVVLSLLLAFAAMSVAIGVRLASTPYRPTPAPVQVEPAADEVWG